WSSSNRLLRSELGVGHGPSQCRPLPKPAGSGGRAALRGIAPGVPIPGGAASASSASSSLQIGNAGGDSVAGCNGAPFADETARLGAQFIDETPGARTQKGRPAPVSRGGP